MKYILLLLLAMSSMVFGQTTNTNKKYQKKGFIDLEDGSVATAIMLRNTVSGRQVRMWYGSDSSGLGPNKYRCYVNLAAFTEANTWEAFDVSGHSENETGIYYNFKIDSSNVYESGVLYRQYIQYKAKIKVYLDAPDSAGPGRRLIYTDLPNLVWSENKRWKKSL